MKPKTNKQASRRPVAARSRRRFFRASLAGLLGGLAAFLGIRGATSASSPPTAWGHKRARLRDLGINLGALPTGLSTTGLRSGQLPSHGELTLLLPTGARLLAGDERVSFGSLGSESTSEAFEWVVLAPEGTTIRFRATSRWTAPAESEVQP